MLSPSGPAYVRERGPFPKGQLKWRKNSAEIPNKIMLTMEHLISCQNKNKLPNKTAKSNYQVTKKHTINSIISKTWERNMNIPKKLLNQKKKIQPSRLMKPSVEIILIHCYYQKGCC